MPEYELEMRKAMKALSEAGSLPHCIVTGSWAMQNGDCLSKPTVVTSWRIHPR